MPGSHIPPVTDARQHRVICLAGPTGSGKTALALEMCSRLGCEVINADSRQVYRDFPVITAQPGPEEFKSHPHWLYGYLETGERTDTADWVQRACAVIREVESRGKLPLVVGGTGFYFQTLLHGIADIPPIPDGVRTRLTEKLAADGSSAMHRRLEQCDPVSAARIHPNDRQRIIRALEVFEATGHPLSHWHEHAAAAAPCYGPLLVTDTPLNRLESRLAARIDAMLAGGALEEAEAALARCPDETAPGWSGIGCREALAFITGRCTRKEMLEQWLHNTRAYAKRQITWFRGRRESIWIDPLDSAGAMLSAEKALG